MINISRFFRQLRFSRSLLFLPLLLSVALYKGAGQNLPVFALFCLLLAFWLASTLTKWAACRPIDFAIGWLPLTALLYLAWLTINPLLSDFAHFSWLTAASLATLPVIFIGWLTQRFPKRDDAWNHAWKLLLLAALALALWGVLQFVVSRERAHGPQIDPNVYSALINMFLLPLCWDYLNGGHSSFGRISRQFRFALIVTLGVAQFMSYSRGGLLALLVTLPWVIWLNRHQPGARTRIVALLLALLTAFIVVRLAPFDVYGTGVARELRSLQVLLGDTSGAGDSSLQQRLLLWRSTWEMYTNDNLLIGTGLGTFGLIYPAYRSPDDRTSGNFAHNDYLQALQEGGLIQFAFFIILTVIAPLWLLVQARRITATPHDKFDTEGQTPGLLFGILAISLHATVNFVHYVLPLTFLTGLYLARSWETIKPEIKLIALSKMVVRLRPSIVASVVYLLLALPAVALSVDGLIFMMFSREQTLLRLIPSEHRINVINALIAIRPYNILPRETLATHLMNLADSTDTPEQKQKYIRLADTEIQAIAKIAPGLPWLQYYNGKLSALKGEPEEACKNFQLALTRLPQLVTFRRELVDCYIRIGEDRRAFETAQGLQPWLVFSENLYVLASLAKTADGLATKYGGEQARFYWKVVLTHLTDYLPPPSRK